MKRLQKTLLNPISISILITLIAAYFWTVQLYPFKMELVHNNASTRYLDVFCDIDNDGTTEQIEFWSKPSLYFIVENEDETIRYAIPLHGLQYIGQNGDVFHDCNNDNNKELIVFTYTDDTIFLNVASLFESKEKIIKSQQVIPLDKFNILNGIPDGKINQVWFNDYNHDGYEEIVFSIMAGFSVSPRRIYIYDIKNKELKKSIDLGCKGFITGLSDIDKDGIKEILLGTGNVNNCTDTCTLPYPDTCAYFIAFDEELNPKFTPLPCNMDRAFASIVPLHENEDLLAWSFSNYPKNARYSTIILKNDSIQLLDTIKLDNYTLPVAGCEFLQYNSPVFYDIKKQQILYFNKENQLTKLFKSKFKITHGFTQKDYFDFDNDDFPDIFFSGVQNELILLSINKKKELSVLKNIDLGNDGYRNLSIKPYNDYWIVNIHCQFRNNIHIKLFKNPLYKWRWGIIFAAFIILSLVFIGIDLFFKYRLKKSLEIRHKLQELQLLNTKSQISPHFLFNALNSISSLIYKEDKEKAYDYITKFSKLHRSLLENSDQVFIPLEEELEFLENYLLLQKLRYKERFEYEIDCAKIVNREIQIPKMLIQGYVENAIKHGLMPKPEGGKVTIKITQTDKLQITIEDNGVGMKATSKVKNRSDSTGKGMRINKQIFDLLEELYKYKILFMVENLDNIDTEETGTRILLELPIKES